MTNEVQGQSQAPGQTPPSVDQSSTPDKKDSHKNFVFIDEQNRHKRLKVVKACDGCRRRKIKCDAANTNIWPCGACVKLKMQCLPPAINAELGDSFTDEPAGYDGYGYQGTMSSYLPQYNSYDDYHVQQQATAGYGPMPPTMRADSSDYPAFQHQQSAFIPGSAMSSFHQPLQQPTPPDLTPVRPTQGDKMRQMSTTSAGCLSDTSESELANQMGDLKISGVGHAPYLINNKTLAEQPAMQEEELDLPRETGPGSQVRIPEEMMPSEEKAQHYFRFFFDNVHPYVPVLFPPVLHQQWADDRNLISPLILEAIFAISARMLGEGRESARWLALAKRHEDYFKDTPRLSTLQGLLLLLKARETMPTRGYYYRSWMSVVTMVAMAKDLRLQEHQEDHLDGNQCDAPKFDCLVRSRVWHTLYIVELMVGGPQGKSSPISGLESVANTISGRIDFGTTTDTVDFKAAYPALGREEPEYLVSQQYSFFLAAIRMVRDSIRIYASLRKKKKDWAIDPGYLDHNSRYERWLDDLPQHLRVSYPEDGSAPYIPFHFVGNLHAYFNLCIIMHHRPQLSAFEDALEEPWRKVMKTCYSAAKRLCRLQEACLNQFGLPGLLGMQRGINFTIYSILTCTMLHLIAVTHPHPDISNGATSYFTRHMKLLERCSSAWPMPEMEKQILSLRQAFSADINKPFELKSDFPGSPARSEQSESPEATSATIRTPQSDIETPPPQRDGTYMQPPQMHSASQYLANEDYPTPDSTSMAMINMEQGHYQSGTHPNVYQAQQGFAWNPSPIIHNFEQMMSVPPDASQNITSPQEPAMSQPTYFPPQASQQPASYSQQYPSYSHARSNSMGYQSHMQGTQPAMAPQMQPQMQPSQMQLPQMQQPQMQQPQMQQPQMQQPQMQQPQMQQPQMQPSYAQPTRSPPAQMQHSHNENVYLFQQNQPIYVTPAMWQSALQASFAPGSKRRYHGNGGGESGHSAKRTR